MSRPSSFYSARIRTSEGKLYGLRLAAISGMILPTIILILIPFAAAAILIRIQSHTLGFLEHDAKLLGAGVFITFAFLSLKLFQGCRRRILGIGKFRGGLGLKKNRIAIGLLALSWVGLGIIFYLQRPKQLDDYATSKSPDGEFSARASTWHTLFHTKTWRKIGPGILKALDEAKALEALEKDVPAATE